jgi:2-polyprenyl-3-methyl-5-hydroxy-6-metoxy-1,4-benzoquinol methylase
MQQQSDKVEAHFHKSYKTFDSFYEEKKGIVSRLIDRLFRRSMQLRYERVIAGVEPFEGRTVLDVGCGAGRYSIALARRGIKKARGIDFAENMIEEAGRQAQQAGVAERCEFSRGDFAQTDLQETYDHVFAMGVLDYIAEPVTFVKKMASVSNRSVMISFPSTGGIVQWFRRQVFKRIKKCPLYLYTEAEVGRIAQQAGAKKFTIDKLAKDYFLTIEAQGNRQ